MPTVNEIKRIQSLKDKKHREEHGLFVAEGHKVVLELLQTTAYRPTVIYAVADYLETVQQASRQTHHWEQVSEKEMERMSLLQSPPEVLAVVPYKPVDFSPFPADNWSLLLDGIQDPGNLGTIVRIADWFGVTHIYATSDTADCFNPKVVQASMGSIFRTKVMYGPCDNWLNNAKVTVYGTAMQGMSIWETQQAKPGVLVIGNEGRGIRQAIATSVDQVLTIPKLGHAESLNAGVATGILLSHLLKP